MEKKRKYPTDTEAGIKTITQIRNLPSCQLTDEEFTKAFFDRFQAKALLLTYVDEKCQYHTFGRLKKGAKEFTYYRSLLIKLKSLYATWNLKLID